MKKKKTVLLSMILALALCFGQSDPAYAAKAKTIPLVILNHYSKTIAIDDDFLLVAITTTGKMPTFKSSNSAVASVNTYGVVTGKRAGTATITAKVKNAEGSCKVTVSKPTITISRTSASMENGASLQLSAEISTGHEITWKSESSAVASVDEDGLVTAKKIGTAVIRASADHVSAKCRITVKKPTISLNRSAVSLYRNQMFKLEVKSSSSKEATFKSSKSSVASVDETGRIYANKHGTANITAKVDGVTKTCLVTVRQPTIRLSQESARLKVGEKLQLQAKVSSGIVPEWSVSNCNRLSVDTSGLVTAREPGKAYVYAKEDGVKASCMIEITE